MNKLHQALIQKFVWARLVLSVFTCLLLAGFLFTLSTTQIYAQADDNFGLESSFQNVEIETGRDLKSIIALVVNISLGFLGVIAVVLIIYAGFMWMTAGGNEDRVAKAKLILRNAVIGLAIILSSWAIASFAISRLSDATGVGGSDPGGGGPGFPDPVGVGAFVVDSVETSHIPPDGDPKVRVTMCSSIQAQFNKYVSSDSFDSLKDGEELALMHYTAGNPIKETSVRLAKRNNTISFKRENTDGSRADWQPSTLYDLRLAKNLRDVRNLPLSNCADCDSDEEDFWRWAFETGTVNDRDVVDPELVNSYPSNGDIGVPRSVIFSLEFSESMDNESLLGEDGFLNTTNIKLQKKDPETDPATGEAIYDDPFTGDFFDVTIRDKSILFTINEQYTAIDSVKGVLEPYTEYRLIVQGLQDLCGNTISPTGEDDADSDGTVDYDISFETGADIPGISFVRPSDGFTNACPSTPVFAQFNTSMYNVRTNSCGVEANGNAGLVLGGSLDSSGVGLRSLPQDNFTGTGNINDFCKQYHFDLDPDSSSDDLDTSTQYIASIDYVKPGGDVDNPDNETWDFTVAEPNNCAQEPYISYVSGLARNQGQWEQCLTIVGNYFGDPKEGASRAYTTLSLTSPRNLPIVPDISFMWGNSQNISLDDNNWNNTAIAADFISEPTKEIPDQNLVDFDIVVEVESGIGMLTSNKKRFTVDTTQSYKGPCLYSITPNSGYWGDDVTLKGKNFKSAETTNFVRFFDGILTRASNIASNGTWAEDKIIMSVPEFAQDNLSGGEVEVLVAGIPSNSLEFNIVGGVGASCSLSDSFCSADANICGNGLECNFACTCQVPESFEIRNPIPTQGCTDSCASAIMGFETTLDIQAIAGNIIQVQKCANESCVWDASGSQDVAIITNLDTARSVSIIPDAPQNKLDLDKWYKVRVLGGSSGLKATDGKQLRIVNDDTDGDGVNDSYTWKFKTGTSECAINSIRVTPTSGDIYINRDYEYSAQARGPSNGCSPAGQVISTTLEWGDGVRTDGGNFENECEFGNNSVGEPDLDVSPRTSADKTIASSVLGDNDSDKKAWVCAKSENVIGASSVTLRQLCEVNNPYTCYFATAESGCMSTCNADTGICNPKITSFTPRDGAPGTWVTINGCYLGNNWGEVYIGSINGIPAKAVQPSIAWCSNTWSSTQIVAEVSGSVNSSGPVSVVRRDSSIANITRAFIPNSNIHPGICRAVPNKGKQNDIISIHGQNLRDINPSIESVDNYNITFKTDKAYPTLNVVTSNVKNICPDDGWSNNQVCIRVNNAHPGNGSVRVAYKGPYINQINIDTSSNANNHVITLDGLNDYVAIKDFHYNENSKINALTIGAWVNTNFQGKTISDNWAIVDFDRSENYNLYIRGDNGTVGFSTTDTSGVINDMRGVMKVNDGKWHYVAVTYNGEDKVIYVDGKKDREILNAHNGNPLGRGLYKRYGFIGDGSEATEFNGRRNNMYFEGSIDELRVYHRALEIEDISKLYESTTNASEYSSVYPAGLVLHYSFENVVDNEIPDLSSTKYNAIINNGQESNRVAFEVLGTPPGPGTPAQDFKVTSYIPGPNNIACLNMIAEVVVDGRIDITSLGVEPNTVLAPNELSNSNFYVQTEGGTVLGGNIQVSVRSNTTKLWFVPSENFELDTGYEIVLNSGENGLRSNTNGTLVSGSVCSVSFDDKCTISFSSVSNAGDDQCRISHMDIEPKDPVYTCARTGCTGDEDLARSGNQDLFTATPINFYGQPTTLNSAISWSSSKTDILDPSLLDSLPNQEIFDIKENNGSTIISAQAVIEGVDISVSTEARVFLCENPWPQNMSVDGEPFKDSIDGNTVLSPKTNFSTFYCRDREGEDLPALPLKCDGGRENNTICNSDESISSCVAGGGLCKKSFAEFNPNSKQCEKGPNIGKSCTANDECNGFKCVPLRNVDGLLKEVFFTQPYSKQCIQGKIGSTCSVNQECNTDDSDGVCAGVIDAIGIRSLALNTCNNSGEFNKFGNLCVNDNDCGGATNSCETNVSNFSIDNWYNSQSLASGPKRIKIDNFTALQDGNAVYVGAPNDTTPGNPSSASIYNNIYLINYSVNDKPDAVYDAHPDTKEIYSQLVNNLRFLVNIKDYDERQKLRRDLIRVNHAYQVADIFKSQTQPVELKDGSYQKGLSLSTWDSSLQEPGSWSEALAQDFGQELPKDSINTIDCTDKSSINQNTCFDPSIDVNSWQYVCEDSAGHDGDAKQSQFYIYTHKDKVSKFGFNLEYAQSSAWNNVFVGPGWGNGTGLACINKTFEKTFQ